MHTLDADYFEENLLVPATADIPPAYMQLPVAGLEDPAYRERVYCYELYHQIRKRWPEWPYSLGGEVDKAGHPLIRGGKLDNAKPDFLVHVPGSMDHNLVVVEVKPANALVGKMLVDVDKLNAFIEHAAYRRGILVVYGAAANLDEVINRAKSYGRDIQIFLHEAAGARALRIA